MCFGLIKANAQDKWQLLVNDKVVASGTVTEKEHPFYLKDLSFKETDKITVKYTSETNDAAWKRSISINDEKDNSLKTIELPKQSGTFSLDASFINQLAKEQKPVTVYTMLSPIDAAKAATVRLRRITIAKILWVNNPY